jgi:hypothetical protein
MIRISGAGMICLIAGCCGVSGLGGFFLPENASREERSEMLRPFSMVLGVLLVILFVTFLVGVGLKVLAGEDSK